MGFVNVGPLELLVIGVIALLVLGPKRLPEAARALGRGLRELREAMSSEDDDGERERDYQKDAESMTSSRSSRGLS
jgi:sec-independent protein translocase protein TatA